MPLVGLPVLNPGSAASTTLSVREADEVLQGSIGGGVDVGLW